MSGGVDSSTAALLLRDQGCEVIGCTMQLWDYRRNPQKDGEPQYGRCCSLDDVYDARRVAEHFGFPFYVLNLEKDFEQQVIQPFIESYLGGRTPLPCTACNTFLKFDRLLKFARQVGVERVATGHYAQIDYDSKEGYTLLKGKDPAKDQSYFLFELTQKQLPHIDFPVGGFEKKEIRRIAGEGGIPAAKKADSQEICFVPDKDYAGFITRHTEEIEADLLPVLNRLNQSGPILLKDGTRIGTHEGVFRFTIGQRRGLQIAHGRPLYVLDLDASRNVVTVGYQEDLLSKALLASKLSWVAGSPPGTSFDAEVKIRARHRQVPARIAVRGGSAEVTFLEPQKAVTPGQAAVFYLGEKVLGGGWIDSEA
jgi:tRNA-specific 2-thiouridylase